MRARAGEREIKTNWRKDFTKRIGRREGERRGTMGKCKGIM